MTPQERLKHIEKDADTFDPDISWLIERVKKLEHAINHSAVNAECKACNYTSMVLGETLNGSNPFKKMSEYLKVPGASE